MKVTPEIVRQEFIGIQAKITNSTHFGYSGVSGKIVDETRNTFTFLDGGKRKIIAKKPNVFHLEFPDGTVVMIEGKLLVGRPEDRLKKSIRRLW